MRSRGGGGLILARASILTPTEAITGPPSWQTLQRQGVIIYRNIRPTLHGFPNRRFLTFWDLDPFENCMTAESSPPNKNQMQTNKVIVPRASVCR